MKRTISLLTVVGYKLSAYSQQLSLVYQQEHTGNYKWLADRMGYSIVGNHPHYMLPENQYPEVEAFIDKFLLGKNSDTSNIQIAVFNQQ